MSDERERINIGHGFELTLPDGVTYFNIDLVTVDYTKKDISELNGHLVFEPEKEKDNV